MILYTICDRLYALRIFRSKISVMLIFLFGFGLFFFFYQLLFVLLLDETQKGKPVGLLHENKLANSKPLSVNVTKIFDERGMVRGIRLMDLSKYKPDQDNMFTCIEEKVKIPFAFVNDDYCDCPLDGSDEPGTNACDNGHFYCYTQLRHRTGRGNAQVISSSKVNDGICDCCDGSDEWKKVIFPNALPIELQIKLHRYLSPCSNTCTK